MKYFLISDFIEHTYDNKILTFKTLKEISYKIWDNKWWLNIYFLLRTITSEIIQNVLTLLAQGPSVDVKTPECNVYRRRIQTSIDGPRAKRI